MRGNLITPSKSNLTFSIDDTVYDSIKNMAQKENQSINSVINQIFSKYLQFYKYIEKQQDVFLPLKMFVPVVDLIGEKDFFDILTTHNNEVIPSVFIHHNIPFTLENLIEYFLKGPMIWGGAYSSISYAQDGAKIILTLGHRKNLLWSKLLGRGLCGLIQCSFGHKCEFEVESSQAIIRIDK